MMFLGYSLAVLMGLVLGLIGAGGSILTVPILVYLMGVKPVVATGYSLLVVGSAALAGAIRYWRGGLVDLRAAITFAVPAMFTVLAMRMFVVPALPDPMLGMPKDVYVMVLFSSLMLLAAAFMLRPLKIKPAIVKSHSVSHAAKLVLGSAGVGVLTGMVGAGGGFLIIPTLIVLFGLRVKEAIGTSLAVIAINSLVGFRGDVASSIHFDWPLLITFISLTLLGMWFGTSLGKRVDGEKLKRFFGVFTLLVGVGVLSESLYTLLK